MVLMLLFLLIFSMTLVCWMLAYSSSHYFDPESIFSLFHFSDSKVSEFSINSYSLSW